MSGPHTADGKPMLANDPHLAYGIPGTWHLVHVKAPGLNVSGAALPGIPCVVSGHNDQIAWGVTNLQTDVSICMASDSMRKPAVICSKGRWNRHSSIGR